MPFSRRIACTPASSSSVGSTTIASLPSERISPRPRRGPARASRRARRRRAEHDQVARVRHEAGQVPDDALDDQRAALHADAAARPRPRITIVPPSIDAPVPTTALPSTTMPRAHRLADRPAGVVRDVDRRARVEAAAVVADGAAEADRHVGRLADAEVVARARVLDDDLVDALLGRQPPHLEVEPARPGVGVERDALVRPRRHQTISQVTRPSASQT